MTTYEKQRVVQIYGEDYAEVDIPTYIRKNEVGWAELHGAVQDEDEYQAQKAEEASRLSREDLLEVI